MAKLFDAVSRFKKIEDVTSTKDDAPPVYLMDEIAELCRDPEQAQSVAEHVNRRLGNRSPIVKWKALKLVRHLCVKGCSLFQRSMQKFASSVRDLVHFKGEADPFTGDAPNQRVRDVAKDVVELLYTSSGPTGTSSALQGRIQGFGSSMPPSAGISTNSSSAPTHTSGTFISGSRMMGFGNAAFNNPPPPPPGSSTLSNGGGGPWARAGGYSSFGSSGNGTSYSDQGTYASGTGGMGTSLTGGGNYGRGGNSDSAAPAASHLNYQVNNTPTNVLGSEEALVDDMCAAGGMRPIPDAQDLRKFVEAASNMDGLKIAELMMSRLGSPQWQVVLRTLCALEAVLQQGLTQACGEIAVMFQSDPSLVRSHITHAQQSVRERAAKCLKLLVGEEVELPAHQPRKPAGPAPDMLAGERPAAAAPAAALAPPPVAAKPKAADPFDLLGDLSSPVKAADGAVPAVAAAAPVPHFDPFAAMPGMGAVPAAVPVAATAPKAPAPLEDLLSSMTVSAGGQVKLGQQLPAAGAGGMMGQGAGFGAQMPTAANTGFEVAWPNVASTSSVPAAAVAPAAPATAAAKPAAGPLDLGFDILAAPATAPGPGAPAAGAGLGFPGFSGTGFPGVNQAQPIPNTTGQMYGVGQPQGYGAGMGYGATAAAGVGLQGGLGMAGQMPGYQAGAAGGLGQPAFSAQGMMGAGPGAYGAAGMGMAPVSGMGVGRPAMPAAGAPMGGQWTGVKPAHQPAHDAAFDFVRDAFK